MNHFSNIQERHQEDSMKCFEIVAPFLRQKRVYCSAIWPNVTILESLVITLRFRAVGASQCCLSFTFRIAPCTVHCVLLEMCTAIWNA